MELPLCAGAQYRRSTFDKYNNTFHVYKDYDYVVNRAPSDHDCRLGMWMRYSQWKSDIEKKYNGTKLEDLWK